MLTGLWTAIANFFSSIGMYLLIFALVIGMLVLGYFVITNTAKQAQLSADQAIELQQALKQSNETLKQTQDLLTQNNQALTDFNTQVNSINDSFSTIKDTLKTPEVIKEDRPSSDLIKNTLKQIQGIK